MSIERKAIVMPDFLPMSRREMDRLGWDELDVLLVTGDAYVDHPAFGPALLGRWLVSRGFRVGIVAQPRWASGEDILSMGRPRLFAGVTAGALDSMVAHYTAFRKKRHDDAYTPGGRAGARPNRASIVYTNLLRHAFPGLPVVLGGIEASLRRTTHYDFWSDAMRSSILIDSKADLLVYGMAERTIFEIARRLDALVPDDRNVRGGSDSIRQALHGLPGTVWLESGDPALPEEASVTRLPSHEEIVADPRLLMQATIDVERLVHEGRVYAVQSTGKRSTVVAPPAAPLDTEELDQLYALPFARRAHPSYEAQIPADEMLKFSITSHRGCAGGCSFCSLALHQGRRIRSRSRRSLLNEARGLTQHPDWTGAITDVGGPTANMWGSHCAADPETCRRESCLWPTICPHFKTSQSKLADLLHELAGLQGIKHVRTASGVRYDLAMQEPGYAQRLVSEFVGGQLKLAPEHSVNGVLDLMRKPRFDAFDAFLKLFEDTSCRAGKQQYVIPYLISAFPGCTDADMHALAKWLKKKRWKPQQVQCFLPTPGTIATAMYAAGIDPRGRLIHVARSDAERLRQHGILVPTTSKRPSKGKT
jgi:uncharacterized radical SAM protein YgiQ